jgi:tRNA A-37 threonylcarbamoyl transferase component Bud32
MSVAVMETSATVPGEVLTRPAAEVFKDDAASTVWRVVGDDGRSWVVKRFNRPAWRQRLAVAVKQHPAQREAFWHARLAEAGVPVLPHVTSGVDAQGRHYLVTPALGLSWFNWLRTCDPHRDTARRHALTRQAGALTGRLLKLRVSNGDHKASNLLLDETRHQPDGAPTLTLIDAGACDGYKGTPLLAAALPMLTNLHRNLSQAAAAHATPSAVRLTRADRMRFFRAMLAQWPKMPDGLQHLPRHPSFRSGG